MKPRKINVAILSRDEALIQRTRKMLSDKALIEIAGEFRSREDMDCANIDVIVAWLSDGAEWLRELGEFPAKLVVIAPSRPDIQKDAGISNYFVYTEGALGTYSEDDLSAKLVYQIRHARLALSAEQRGAPSKPKTLTNIRRPNGIRLIAVGASAGGTEAIMRVLPQLPADAPAVMLVQHMPARFVSLFAGHLRDKCRMKVCLATGGETVCPGTIYLTELDRHLTVAERGGALIAVCEEGARVSGARPSVDSLFFSAAALGGDAIGVILTGMGADGADGLSAMRRAGAFTIGQDKKSCVVYGMPGAAFRRGAVAKQLPLSAIAGELIRRTGGQP